MDVSKKYLQKLGKELRSTDGYSKKLAVTNLENYRRSFDPNLITAGKELNLLVNNSEVPFILSGRLKRVKSIVRKLIREPSMDLSRMSDIIGLRIVVENLDSQTKIINSIRGFLGHEKIRDYTNRDEGYRSVHFSGNWEGKPIEIQIRSLAQQLWAFESESLGEQSKEGGGNKLEKQYLLELCKTMKYFDENASLNKIETISELFQKRRTLEYRFPWLVKHFETVKEEKINKPISIIIVHDTKTKEIVNSYNFSESNRSEAIKEFEYLSRTLNEDRYNIILFNTYLKNALQVTHPTFHL